MRFEMERRPELTVRGKCDHATCEMNIELAEDCSIDRRSSQRLSQLTNETRNVDDSGKGALAGFHSHRHGDSGMHDILVIDGVGQVDVAVVVVDLEGLPRLERD